MDVSLKNKPVAGDGPKDPIWSPWEFVIWKEISLSYDPELKLKSTMLPE